MSNTSNCEKTEPKPAWLLYANCQAAAIAELLPRTQLRNYVNVKYVFIHSLEEPGKGWETFPANFMDDVTCVFEQTSEAFPAVRAEFHRRLPKGIPVIKFPALTANMIWPFAGPDPRPSRRRPYLYGDLIAARLGMLVSGTDISDDELFSRYMELSLKKMPDLERSLELQRWNWNKRDANSDIHAAPFLSENFQKLQLFYERGRITQHSLRFLLARLLTEALRLETSLPTGILEEAMLQLRYHQGSDNISQPIHPFVAERLDLKWFRSDALYRWFMHDLSFRDWIIRCVRYEPYVAGNF